MKKQVLSFDKGNRFMTIRSYDLESRKVFSQRSLIHSDSFQKKLNHTQGFFNVNLF